MADDRNMPILEEATNQSVDVPRPEQDVNNRGNFTRNLNKEQDSVVAKKIFFGGLCLLPWLHLVNVIFYRKQFLDPSIDPEVTKWTRRSFMSFCLITILFLTWVIVFQTKWDELGWGKLVMVMPPKSLDPEWYDY